MKLLFLLERGVQVAKIIVCVAVTLFAVASPVLAKSPCPPNKYAPPYPWFIKGLMDGDTTAEIFIDVDKSGKPINCRMGQNNVRADDRFWVCKAFLDHWSTSDPSTDAGFQPPPANLPANSPVKATIYRKYLEYGEKHEKAERQARAQFFQQRPEERPECYPSEDD